MEGHSQRNLSLLFLNIQGLTSNTKIGILESFLVDTDIQVICLSEHWLSEEEIKLSVPESFYCATAYCRSEHIRGGTSVFLHKNIKSRILDVSTFCKELTFEASAIFIDEIKTIVVSMYHSPNGNPTQFLEIVEQFLHFLTKWPNYNILLGGDFNDKFNVLKPSKTVKELLNLLKQYNFYYLNDKPTRGGKCLDNVFIYEKTATVSSVNILNFPFSDHNGILVKICIFRSYSHREKIENKNTEIRTTFYLPRKNINSLYLNLNSYDWQNLLLQSDVNDSETVFQRVFNILINNLNYFMVQTNIKSIKRKNKNKQEWYTRDLAVMKEKLLFLHSIMKNTNNLQNTDIKSKYDGLKDQYKKSIKDAKLFNNVSYIEKSNNKCKAAWNLIKKNDSSKEKVQSNIAADVFNQYFTESIDEIKDKLKNLRSSNVFSDFINKNVNSENVKFEWKHVTPKQVVAAVQKMKNSQSKDIFGMSNNLLKSIISSLDVPLAYCINLLLAEGKFPGSLKVSRVCPVYKKGPVDKPQGFRPISIIPVVGKLIEILVFDQVTDYFEKNKFFNVSQHGFRRGLSTIEALDNLVRQIIQSFEDKAFAQATFCDLSRAFDCVDLDILTKKLSLYGFNGSSLNFFESYLLNRKQLVSINGKMSEEKFLKWGVPQGSVLGPLLFIIYINDLPLKLNTNTILYADDTTFLHISKNVNELQNLFNMTMINASNWFHSNGFLLNEEKTQNIFFTLNRNFIPPTTNNSVGTARFLGLHIDSQLSWNSHIDQLSSKLSRIIFLLRRLRDQIPESYLRTAYFGYFQSVLRYGLIFWGGSGRIKDILKFQKKALRTMSRSDPKEHCKPLFVDWEVQTVINLYIFDLMTYILKNKVNLNFNNHTYNTRNKKNALLEPHRLSKTSNSHLILSIKVYNVLERFTNIYTVKVFKKKFYEWLLGHPFYSLDEFFNYGNVQF